MPRWSEGRPACASESLYFCKGEFLVFLNLASLCDLFGMVKWPFQRLSDLQLGDKEVTLNHLVNMFSFLNKTDNSTALFRKDWGFWNTRIESTWTFFTWFSLESVTPSHKQQFLQQTVNMFLRKFLNQEINFKFDFRRHPTIQLGTSCFRRGQEIPREHGAHNPHVTIDKGQGGPYNSDRLGAWIFYGIFLGR